MVAYVTGIGDVVKIPVVSETATPQSTTNTSEKKQQLSIHLLMFEMYVYGGAWVSCIVLSQNS